MSRLQTKSKRKRSPQPRNVRDAAATREAIRSAARKVFSKYGFDAAGVREIAAEAGVNQALVNRYFESKEGLYVSAITESFSVKALLNVEHELFADVLARYLVFKEQKTDEFDPTLAMMRSVGSNQAAKIIRTGLQDHFVDPISDWLTGENRPERAALIVSVLGGIALMRDVLKLEGLNGREEELSVLIAKLLATLTLDAGAS